MRMLSMIEYPPDPASAMWGLTLPEVWAQLCRSVGMYPIKCGVTSAEVWA